MHATSANKRRRLDARAMDAGNVSATVRTIHTAPANKKRRIDARAMDAGNVSATVRDAWTTSVQATHHFTPQSPPPELLFQSPLTSHESPAEYCQPAGRTVCPANTVDEHDVKTYLSTFDSTLFVTEEEADPPMEPANSTPVPGRQTRGGGGRRTKKEATHEDKVYRSDREYVKRHSHQTMMWFLRRVGLRHAAAIRTHLERVKHPEFELPNLQCVYPHPELSLAFDDRCESAADDNVFQTTRGCGRPNDVGTNLTYYNLYCATDELVERVRTMMRTPKREGRDYNKRVVSFIADIVGRLLWHTNRTHAVMFAKSDHYDRDCFILYSRQAEPTPQMMRSDSYFCRRHNADKFKSFAPQPDLTRANSSRVSNESAIYVVGCNVAELWNGYPYEYRVTNCRPIKALCESVGRIDPSVMEHAFSALRAQVSGERECSSCPSEAAKTVFDVLTALLGDSDLKKDVILDDSTTYRDYLERFITLGVLNVHAMLRGCYETTQARSHSDTPTHHTPLDSIVLHNVRYRRETRSLRTNRVFYYRNADDYVCSLSLLDDLFEDRKTTPPTHESNRRPVYFYDILQPSEYAVADVNDLAFTCWQELETTITESAYTIGQRFHVELLRGQLPQDPFYPNSDMSVNDLAIDRVLERAIKHSKKIKHLASVRRHGGRAPRSDDGRPPSTSRTVISQDIDAVLQRSMSKTGENRLKDGYKSPSRLDFETTVSHDGQDIPVKVTVGDSSTQERPVDYGPKPRLLFERKLVCAYLIDPKDGRQVNIVPGSRLVNRTGNNGYVPLNATDRIVRVFTVQAKGASTYVVKPYVYFVFRDMPVCGSDDNLLDEMFKTVKSYDGFRGFRVFDDFERNDTDPQAAAATDTGHHGGGMAYDPASDLMSGSFPSVQQYQTQLDPSGGAATANSLDSKSVCGGVTEYRHEMQQDVTTSSGHHRSCDRDFTWIDIGRLLDTSEEIILQDFSDMAPS